MTASQCMVILAIRLSPSGETTMTDIAKKIGVTKQNVTQMIPLLEKKGYVKKIYYDNKHVFKIKATESGLSAMLECAGADATSMTEIFQDLTENEMEIFLFLLQKLKYNGSNIYSNLANDAYHLLEIEHSEFLVKIFEEYKKSKH
jgi:DNA-binding MarR family transcriptional regulator